MMKQLVLVCHIQCIIKIFNCCHVFARDNNGNKVSFVKSKHIINCPRVQAIFIFKVPVGVSPRMWGGPARIGRVQGVAPGQARKGAEFCAPRGAPFRPRLGADEKKLFNRVYFQFQQCHSLLLPNQSPSGV